MKQINQGTVTTAKGFSAAATANSIKHPGRLDLALVASPQDSAAAAVFTQNRVVAAPVIVDRETLAANRGRIRAVVANAGVANACTGQPGMSNTRAMQQITADSLHCQPDQVLVLSTGVIGVQLPMDKIESGIRQAATELSPQYGEAAARAIMTTDTHPKHLAVQVSLPQGDVTIGGMAKGAGMIHPNMATLLVVLTTDAAVAPETLQPLLESAVDRSFNCISVDGDTSTNDTALILANGASDVTVGDDESRAAFGWALNHICLELAKMIVRDGEGASKFVEIQVAGAATEAEAHAVAETIATSPLVKTAFAGSDANWGRILAAAGRAGVDFDQNRVGLWIGTDEATELQLVDRGTPTGYREADAARIFAQTAVIVHLDLGSGDAAATMWTSDLTHEYVRINADYRT